MPDKVLQSVDRLAPKLIAFSQELVRTKSVTGEEEAAQDLVNDKLRSLGAAVDKWKPQRADFKGYGAFVAEEAAFAHRPNLVGRFKAPRSGRSLAFNGHIDVVPEGDPGSWKHLPYGGNLVRGKLFGRGACDMKAGLAATLFAVEALLDAGATLQGDILVESVIGEESGGVGTLATILRGHIPDAAIIAEPTNLKITIAQAGCLMFRLIVKGRAAHGASRFMGVSAVEKFQPVLAALQGLEARRCSMMKLPLYAGVPNPVPLSIGTVRAGNWDSTVPERLVAEGRYGVWPGESLRHARLMFERAIASAASKDSWLRENPPEVSWFGPQWESAELDPSHWLSKLMQKSYHLALGVRPKLSGTTGGTDMRLFTKVARVPAVLFGPGDDSKAHFGDEHILVKDVLAACKVYAMAALAWNG